MVITTYGNNLGPAVRASTPSGGNDYDCVVNSTTMFLQRIVGGAVGGLTSVGITGVSGDVIRLEVVGSPPQLSCFQNGVLRLGPFTDNLAGFLTSGQPGISGIGIGGAIGDNWSGGSLQPIAQLVVEQDWTQPQHFIQPITVGPTNPIAGTLAANTLYVPNVVASTFKTGNAAPTCASTGLGTGGTCGNFATGSDDISGNFLMTAGTTASATGTITLTFNVASVGNAFCTIYLSNQTAAWAATATSFPIFGTSTNQAVWANGGVSLVNTNQYAVGYFCSRH
jgi:hypothetical protein